MPALDSRRLIRRVPNRCLLASAWLLAAWACAPSLAAPPVTWALAPYRIRVFLSAEASPEWPPARRAELARELAARSQSLAGAVWQLDVVESPRELSTAARAGLDRVPASPAATRIIESLALAPDGPEKEIFDKVILLHLAADPSGEKVSACEWDAHTATWGPTIVRSAPRGGLGHAAFSAVHAACGTLGRVELPSTATQAAAPANPAVPAAKTETKPEGTAGRVFLRIRGADLTPRDSSLAPAHVGDVFRVVRRSPGSAARLATSEAVPWTYLTIEKIVGGLATCRVHSHYRDPLAQPLAAREEWIAVGVSATGLPSTFKVVGAAAAGTSPPVSGLEVLAYSPAASKPVSLGRTGRDGALVVPSVESALRVLILKRGPDLVARYPLVPGWPAAVEVALAGDETRLAVSASAAAIELRLLELVTRREIEIARLRARVKAKRKVEAEQLIAEIQTFDAKRGELDKLIQDEKTRIAAPDAEAQAHVNQVFAALATSVARHFDPGPIQQLVNDLAAEAPADTELDAAPPEVPQDPAVVEALKALGCTISRAKMGGKWREMVVAGATSSDAMFAQAIPQIKTLKEITAIHLQSPLTTASLPAIADLPDVVFISGEGATIAGLQHLSAMTRLEGLALLSTGVKTDDWPHIVKLSGLRTLAVPMGPSQPADIAGLKMLVNLEHLEIAQEVTPEALGEIGKLPSLKTLRVPLEGATDATLAMLKGLTQLESLELKSPKVSDAGLAQLAGLTKLRSLSLENSAISDAGLAQLASLTALESLSLASTKITDQSLPALKAMTGLKELQIWGTGISPGGITELQTALPGAKVIAVKP